MYLSSRLLLLLLHPRASLPPIVDILCHQSPQGQGVLSSLSLSSLSLSVFLLMLPACPHSWLRELQVIFDWCVSTDIRFNGHPFQRTSVSTDIRWICNIGKCLGVAYELLAAAVSTQDAPLFTKALLLARYKKVASQSAVLNPAWF